MNKTAFGGAPDTTLIVWAESVGAAYQLVLEDVVQVFSRYGPIASVEFLHGDLYAVVHFTSAKSAQKAIKELNNKVLIGVQAVLRVCFFISLNKGDNRETISRNKLVKKYTARYDVQIDPNNGFEVAKRIIGLNGTNMKLIHSYTHSKLRLRGRGSGYLEGVQRREAPEPLHLCISCQFRSNYVSARCLVEELLTKIYQQYDAWLKESGKSPAELKPKLYEVLIHVPVSGKAQTQVIGSGDFEHRGSASSTVKSTSVSYGICEEEGPNQVFNHPFHEGNLQSSTFPRTIAKVYKLSADDAMCWPISEGPASCADKQSPSKKPADYPASHDNENKPLENIPPLMEMKQAY